MRIITASAAAAVLTLISATALADTPTGFDLFEPFPNGNGFGVFWNKFSKPPSIQTEDSIPLTINYTYDYLSCVDEETGFFLDCIYSYQVKGLDKGDDPEVPFGSSLDATDTYGGHSHNQDPNGPNPHPFIYVPPIPQSLIQVFGGVFSQPDNYTIDGSTKNMVVQLATGRPEAAGATWTTTTIIAPPDYVCGGGCYDKVSTKVHETNVTETPGFVQLPLNFDPAAPYDYVVLRSHDPEPSGDPGHSDSDAEWALPTTIDQFTQIAQKYNELTPWSGKLRINDMSLPHGGVFDIRDDWDQSIPHAHKDHRAGIAFDLNTTDTQNQPLPCSKTDNSEYWYRLAVEEQNGLKAKNYNEQLSFPIAIVCESGGRIHINVNSISPLQLLNVTQIPSFTVPAP